MQICFTLKLQKCSVDDEPDRHHHHRGGEDVLFWVNWSFNFRSQLDVSEGQL